MSTARAPLSASSANQRASLAPSRMSVGPAVKAPASSASSRASISGANFGSNNNNNIGSINNNRRTIAGDPPMQQQQQASRGSIGSRPVGGGRPSIGMGGGRMSMAGGNVGGGGMVGGAGGDLGRRSTISSQVRTEDPRPIKDGQFQERCRRRIVTCLATYGYPHPISEDTLKSPSDKDFFNVVQFLFQQIDPSFVLQADGGNGKQQQQQPGAERADEMIFNMFRRLKYPFPLNKSYLARSVGAGHSWPTVLAAIFWVVELLDYGDRVMCETNGGMGGEGDDFSVNNPEKMFFEYLARAYDAFLKGKDDNELEGELVQQFESKHVQLQEQVNELNGANEHLREQIKDYSHSKLDELKEQKETLLSDCDKFRKLLTTLAAHVQAGEKKVEELEKESEGKEVEIQEVKNEIEVLTRQIAEQPVSAAEAQRMAQERQQLRDRAMVVSEHKEQARQAMFAAEVQLSKKLAEVETQIHQYKAVASKLKLLVPGSKRACGQNVDIQLSSNGGDAVDTLLALDCKSSIRKGLEIIKTEASRRLSERQRSKVDAEEAVRRALDSLLEKKEEVSSLEKELEKTEADLRREKECREEDIRQRAAKSSALEENAMRTKSEISQRINKARAELREVETKCEELEANLQMEERQQKDEIENSIVLIASHKLFVQSQLNDLLKDVGDIYNEVHM